MSSLPVKSLQIIIIIIAEWLVIIEKYPLGIVLGIEPGDSCRSDTNVNSLQFPKELNIRNKLMAHSGCPWMHLSSWALKIPVPSESPLLQQVQRVDSLQPAPAHLCANACSTKQILTRAELTLDAQCWYFWLGSKLFTDDIGLLVCAHKICTVMNTCSQSCVPNQFFCLLLSLLPLQVLHYVFEPHVTHWWLSHLAEVLIRVWKPNFPLRTTPKSCFHHHSNKPRVSFFFFLWYWGLSSRPCNC
jgi:hypothetical protein